MKERSECKLPASSSHVIHDELRSLGRGKQLMCRLNRLSSVLAPSERAQGRRRLFWSDRLMKLAVRSGL
jgi:hypothetical protein